MAHERMYDLRKALNEKCFNAIKEKKQVMYLIAKDEHLIGNEVEEWINSHSMFDPEPRVLGHYTTATYPKGEPIYVLHCTLTPGFNMIIPMERLKEFPVYEDFMTQLSIDIGEDLEK